MSPNSFSLINTANGKLCDSNSIPYARGSPSTVRYYFIFMLMHISGSRVSPMELVPIFCLLGHSKLRSEARGGPILLVSEGISFHFPLWRGLLHHGFKHSLRPCLLIVWLRCQEDPVPFSSFSMIVCCHLASQPLQPQQSTSPTDEATISPSCFQPVTWSQQVHLLSRLSSGVR